MKKIPSKKLMSFHLIFLFHSFVAFVSLYPPLSHAKGEAEERPATSPPASIEATNTKRNEEVGRAEDLTAEDQSQSKSDLEITQKIRQSLLKEDSLSMLAKNAKIITNNGEVTLKGPVKSEVERKTIERITKQVKEVQKVNNLLEIDRPKS